jgi:hypothetical protein
MLFHACLKLVSHGTAIRAAIRKAQIAGDFCHSDTVEMGRDDHGQLSNACLRPFVLKLCRRAVQYCILRWQSPEAIIWQLC